MTRGRVIACFAFLGLALAAALTVLPARWLTTLLPGHWPVALVDADGTVWSGTAALALGPEHNRRRLPEPLRWHWTFNNGPRLELTHPWMDGPLLLALTPSGLAVSPRTLSLPASALAIADARLAAIGPEGRLSLRWPALLLSHTPPADGARLLEAEWREAASALTPIRPLGHYTLTLTAKGNGNELLLNTRQGPLMLEGKGTVAPGFGLDFAGTARVDSAAGERVSAALQDVLAALGPRQNNVTMLRLR